MLPAVRFNQALAQLALVQRMQTSLAAGAAAGTSIGVAIMTSSVMLLCIVAAEKQYMKALW